MSEHIDKPRNRVPSALNDRKKAPYQKPAFRHERVFETMALVCGKITSSQQSCRTLTKTS